MATATDQKITIPESPEELQEALLDDDWRAKAFADAESTKDFLAAYNKLVNKGEHISKQVSDQMESTMLKFLKDNGISDLPSKSDIAELIPHAKAQDPKISAQYNPYAPGASAERIGFKGFGHLAQVVLRDRGQAAGDVRLSEEDNRLYNELKRITAQYSSDNPESAGFLIPESTRAEVMSLALEQSVVRPNATVITMGTKTVDIPYVDVTSHASSLFGGMIWYWTAESASLTQTEAQFGKVRLEANKLTGSARIPNELLADAPALGSFLNRALPSGLSWFEDDAFIRGSGVGEPLGFLQSPAIVQATRTTTDEVDTEDIANMYARMLPQSLGSAVWVVNQTVIPQLLTMDLAVGSGGSVTGLVGADFTQAVPFRILGRPVVVSEKMPALAGGSGNDIMFLDLSYYLIGDRQAVSIDSSAHSRFLNDETEIRIINRVDGRPWIQSALTPAQGSDTLTPFVGLAD